MFELALHEAVFPLGAGLRSQTAVGLELPLDAKTIRRLHQSDQQGRPNWTDQTNLPQQIHRIGVGFQSIF
jgi:hypothetical protein